MKILGISFNSERAHRLVQMALRGGLVVVPSGPGLARDFIENPDYRQAVLGADIVVPDSGAMVLFAFLFRGKRLRRQSGLNLLQVLLEQEPLKSKGSTFWIHPSEEQRFCNENWLKKQGFKFQPRQHYTAPFYSDVGISDPILWEQLIGINPKVIIICIGGGVQERLGYWLRQQFENSRKPCPAIICTGAAIGFLSGNQVNIPRWADRFYLGWFFRCLAEPSKFIPRYVRATPLIFFILRYGELLPPLKSTE